MTPSKRPALVGRDQALDLSEWQVASARNARRLIARTGYGDVGVKSARRARDEIDRNRSALIRPGFMQ